MDFHVAGAWVRAAQRAIYYVQREFEAQLVGVDTRGRSLPARAEARAFQIHSPPLIVALGNRDVVIGDQKCGPADEHCYRAS